MHTRKVKRLPASKPVCSGTASKCIHFILTKTAVKEFSGLCSCAPLKYFNLSPDPYIIEFSTTWSVHDHSSYDMIPVGMCCCPWTLGYQTYDRYLRYLRWARARYSKYVVLDHSSKMPSTAVCVFCIRFAVNESRSLIIQEPSCTTFYCVQHDCETLHTTQPD